MTEENETNSIELEDTFFLYGHSTRKQYILKLSPINLSITLRQDENDDRTSTKNSTKLISIDDIYGCLCMKSTKNPTECHLTFYLYTLKRSNGISGIFSKKLDLHRSQKIFTYDIYHEYERNYAEVIRWHRHVKHAIYLRQNLPRKFK
jgi:hypothetical protein